MMLRHLLPYAAALVVLWASMPCFVRAAETYPSEAQYSSAAAPAADTPVDVAFSDDVMSERRPPSAVNDPAGADGNTSNIQNQSDLSPPADPVQNYPGDPQTVSEPAQLMPAPIPNTVESSVQQAVPEQEQQAPPGLPENNEQVAAPEQPPVPRQPQQPVTAQKEKSSPPKPIHLFGYVEFRGPLKDVPKWQRVLDEERNVASFGGDENVTLTPTVAKRWAQVKEKIKDAPLPDKLRAVNNFFNQWPYKTDLVVWGLEDFWATPREFVRKSGDCEDYAIAKYYALRSLGVPASQMRVVAIMERIRGIGHAVLVVFMNDNAYVLDNLTNLVLLHSRFTHYEPKFSLNEEYRWVHVKPIKKPKKQ